MTPLVTVVGRAIPLGRPNIDTDVIIPARWLKTITREGLGQGAFETIRTEAGNPFDDPDFSKAPILIAGDNFGCGSSREHAAWALLDLGIRVVIAPSFGDIFAGNAARNGILTIVQPQPVIDRLLRVAATDPVTVDLDACRITTPFQDRFDFTVDPFRRGCLLNGLDDIALTRQHADAIAAHEVAMTARAPWARHVPAAFDQG